MKTGPKNIEVINDSSARGESAGKAAPMGRRWETRRIIMCLFIFLLAFGVRFLSYQDTRREVEKVQTVVAGDYRRVAVLLRTGGFASFFSPASPLSDPNTLGHPPGYSILLAIIYSLMGESSNAAQFIQIIFDALCSVLIYLIVAELFPAAAALLAGLLAAFSPQFAWNSVLLLPDSLAVFPILLAMYLIARSTRRPGLWTIAAAGACVGLSCWLRANALLLAPFLALACLVLYERGRRLRYGAALLVGAILVIAPLTIRNAVVFRHFIPLSLGAGQTLLEGIADYDREGRFGMPATDMGIMKWEAETFNRPDYYGTLFNPDGIWRERMRLKRGLAIARSHPFWFLGVMVRRAVFMLRLERARLISTEPPVSHSLDGAELQPAWLNSPMELKASSVLAPQAKTALAQDNQGIELTGDDSEYGDQLMSAPFEIQKDTDYVLTLPAKILRGRMSIQVKSANGVRASTIVETKEMKTPEEQPESLIQLPFVSGRSEHVQMVISNAASREAKPTIRMGAVRLYRLGPASDTWTGIPRSLINIVQKLYITAVMLPLSILGIILLARARRFRTLAVLLVVPVYYLSVQSAIHTEYRYVLGLHYFLFAFAAIFIYTLVSKAAQRLRKA